MAHSIDNLPELIETVPRVLIACESFRTRDYCWDRVMQIPAIALARPREWIDIRFPGTDDGMRIHLLKLQHTHDFCRVQGHRFDQILLVGRHFDQRTIDSLAAMRTEETRPMIRITE